MIPGGGRVLRTLTTIQQKPGDSRCVLWYLSLSLPDSNECHLRSSLCLAASRMAYLAMTTVVQELFSFGRSRLEAMRIVRAGRSPRMIGQ